jgi:hypothetical protein
VLLLLLLLPPAAAAIPHIAASNTAAVPSATANPDVLAAAIAAADTAVPASEFQENPLEGRRDTDHKVYVLQLQCPSLYAI